MLGRAARPDGVLRLVWTAEARCVMTTRERADLGRAVRLFAASARRGGFDPTAGLKSTSRLFYELAQREARAAGADEALILGSGDTVLETATGNVFASIDGRLCTPADNGAFLAGIARAILLERLPVEQRAIGHPELLGAEAIWVTNAVHGPRRAVVGERPQVAAEGEDPLAAAWRAFDDQTGSDR